MATREENLKKINDELEKLTDAELEKVANEQLNEDELDAVAGGRPKWIPGPHKCHHGQATH